MYSVFSNHFIECYYNYLVGTQPQLSRDKIEPPTLAKALNFWIERQDLKESHWCPQLFMTLHPDADIADKIVFNQICKNPELRKVEQWATKNILLCIKKDWNVKTRHVKFRIVAGMLNKLAQNHCISEDDNIYMFNNMVINMHDLDRDLIYTDLPF